MRKRAILYAEQKMRALSRFRDPLAPAAVSRQFVGCDLFKVSEIMKNPNLTQIGGNHYASKKVQPWDAMEAWMSRYEFIGFLRGNVIKYIARCQDKGKIEDLKKAAHYLDKLINFVGDK